MISKNKINISLRFGYVGWSFTSENKINKKGDESNVKRQQDLHEVLPRPASGKNLAVLVHLLRL